MSSLIVEVCRVDDVQKHPNADKMEIAVVKGWRTCIVKGQMQKGDLCVYIPPDSILPIALSDRLNVTKYLSLVKNEQGEVVGARVKVARLRGEPSYGLTMVVEDSNWGVGHDVAGHYCITKWEPLQECTDGDAEIDNPSFHRYFNLENIFNFPNVIQDGEECVFTEKIHGKNARVGLIRDVEKDGSPIWRFMAGSNDVRRKEFEIKRKRRAERHADGTPVIEKVIRPVRNEKGRPVFADDGITPVDKLVLQEKEWFYETTKRSQFFEVLDTIGIRELLLGLCNGQNNVVVFGELYGSGVQDMAYGFKNGETFFRVFDITINGKYIDFDDKVAACDDARVQMVPVLYRGPYSKQKMEEYVTGQTTLCCSEEAGAFKGREGIVITTVKERTANTEQKLFGRAAVKAVSFEYLERKDGTELH